MTPLMEQRIKKANGNIKIKQVDNIVNNITVQEWQIQALENGTWQTIYKSRDRCLCERIVSKANRQIILG